MPAAAKVRRLARGLSIRLQDVLRLGDVVGDEHDVRSSLPRRSPGTDRRQCHVATRTAFTIARKRARRAALNLIPIRERLARMRRKGRTKWRAGDRLATQPGFEAHKPHRVVRHRPRPEASMAPRRRRRWRRGIGLRVNYTAKSE